MTERDALLDSPPVNPQRTEPIQVTVERDDARTLVRVAGEIDLLTVGQLQQPLEAALAAGGRVQLDLTDVEFIDSTGLRLLLEARGRAERSPGTAFQLVLGETHAVRRLLDLTGVLDLFDVA